MDVGCARDSFAPRNTEPAAMKRPVGRPEFSTDLGSPYRPIAK
jgi:hypothetical protein